MAGTHEIDSGRGWVVAFGGCLINTWTFGVFYAFATALEQMVAEFNASLSGIAAFFSVTTFLFFATGMLAGPLADRFGARRLVAVGAFLMGGGLWLTPSRVSVRRNPDLRTRSWIGYWLLPSAS